MATVHPIHASTVTEAARLAGLRPSSAVGAGQEEAMARRLEQLQAALGESFPLTPRHEASTRRFQLTTLILASLSSAMVGAGVMRLAMASTPPATQAVVVSAASVPKASIATTNPPSAPRSDEQEIAARLESWRQAWQSRDISRYLGSYAAAFRPMDGSSHDAWAAARTRKLATTTPIEVQLRNIVIERVEPTLYQVRFQQDYAAGNYHESGRAKTLLVAREDGHWKIVREQQD